MWDVLLVVLGLLGLTLLASWLITDMVIYELEHTIDFINRKIKILKRYIDMREEKHKK